MSNQNLENQEEETFTCQICIEPVRLNGKFNNKPTCVHPFCTDCIIKYIQVKLEENVSDIKCPATTCSHSLNPVSCIPKITHALFIKWCDTLCESGVIGLDKVYCPNMECSELILNGVSVHGEETMDENDIAFNLVFKRENWKRCPRCRHCVQRIGGCNAIKCRCGIRFCYECGKRSCVCKSSFFCLGICGFVLLIMAIIFIVVMYLNRKRIDKGESSITNSN